MAPLEKGVYARARICRIEKETRLVKVRFIDEGITAWMKRDCLAKMDQQFAFHPWQAIGFALFKVKPRQTCLEYEEAVWCHEDTVALREIMKKFEFFHTEIIFGSTLRNNYRDFFRMFGGSCSVPL
ncbi:unnamed protein product [Gongylonema pulchrum]|uniref:Tudor domain-containing protein n=1 Tax=Gongylonema pulchrum TaxID=637853 RepID=A0A183EEE5_9BILA|nr:unnamed protein product [Gongylonema pulchrum]